MSRPRLLIGVALAASACDRGASEVPDAGDGAAYECQPMALTVDQACAITLTGEVRACSIDPQSGVPSQTGWLLVRKPDGSSGYLCASRWTADDGYYFSVDRIHLVDAASACCGGGPGTQLDWFAPDPFFGVVHGPTRVKPHELMAATGGALRENPFAVVVSSTAGASALEAARQDWQAWAGDGQPHAPPGGTGSYWFPSSLTINYDVVPTTTGQPLIVIAPEASMDPDFDTPLGHPTLGACAAGGAPLAFLAGALDGTILSNRSGRFGQETTVTEADLVHTAALFNCYGIPVTGVEYVSPWSVAPSR